MGQLDNKVAIVTRAGSRFGERIASLYAKEGAKVVMADINVAAVALFLASDAAGFITGSELPVDGGRTV